MLLVRNNKTNKLRGLSPRANYTDRAAAAGRRSWCYSGYRYRGSGFDFRRYQIFWVVVGLERGPLSLVRSIEELLEKKVAAPGLENRD